MKPVFTGTYRRSGSDIHIKVFETTDGSKPVFFVEADHPEVLRRHRERIAVDVTSPRFGGPENVSWWETNCKGGFSQYEFSPPREVKFNPSWTGDMNVHVLDDALRKGLIKQETVHIRNVDVSDVPAEGAGSAQSRLGGVPKTREQERSLNQSLWPEPDD